MDTFMDKLAQKLNAQEMIRANSAADAEEMGKLKNQIKEYNDCLQRLEQLLDRGDESIAKMDEMQKDTKDIEAMKAALEELKACMESSLGEQKTSLESSLEEQKSVLDTKLNECNENVHKECVKVYRNVQAVVVEEDAKLAENVEKSVNVMKGKLNVILGVSVSALVFALASVALQILHMFNFKFF